MEEWLLFQGVRSLTIHYENGSKLQWFVTFKKQQIARENRRKKRLYNTIENISIKCYLKMSLFRLFLGLVYERLQTLSLEAKKNDEGFEKAQESHNKGYTITVTLGMFSHFNPLGNIRHCSFYYVTGKGGGCW